MRRRRLTVASVLSLLLCLPAIVAWMRSYQQTDFFHWNRDDGGIAIGSSTGSLWIHRQTSHQAGAPRFDHVVRVPAFDDMTGREPWATTHLAFAGFMLASGSDGFGHRYMAVCPYYFVICCLAITPTVWLLTRRVRRGFQVEIANI